MRRAWIATLACLSLASPLYAQYVYDPADLPEGFTCVDEPDYLSCDDQKREAAWHELYGERFNFWLHSMLFRTEVYFAGRVAALPELKTPKVPHQLSPYPKWTPNLIDARYDVQLRRMGDWAFAINKDALLRLVRYKTEDEIAPDLAAKAKAMAPTTLSETAQNLQIAVAFEEADLTQCDGAIAHLLRFPAQTARRLWDTKELSFSPDYAPQEPDNTIAITLDGAGVYVRTQGVSAPDETTRPQVFYREFNRGAVFDWTVTMHAHVKPCLKPSENTPPWQKFVEAQQRKAARAASRAARPTTPE